MIVLQESLLVLLTEHERQILGFNTKGLLELGQSRKAFCRKSKAGKQDLERECGATLGSPEFRLQRIV